MKLCCGDCEYYGEGGALSKRCAPCQVRQDLEDADDDKLRRVHRILGQLTAVRLPPEGRALVREAYGILGDDTALGFPGKRELEELE